MAMKKAATKAAPKAPTMKPIKDAMSKSGLVTHIADFTGLPTRDVRAVLAALEQTMHASVSKKGAGSFTMPGAFKITAVEQPARPAREGTNPFTGEKTMFKARPKSMKLKVRPLKKLKDAAA